MAQVQVNTGAGRDTDFDEVPAGTYECVVHGIELREGPNAPYLNVDLLVASGEFEGRHIFSNVTLSDKAEFRAGTFFRALGAPVVEGQQTLDTDEFINRPVRVKVSYKENPKAKNGKSQETNFLMHQAVRDAIENSNSTTPQGSQQETEETVQVEGEQKTAQTATTGTQNFSL